LSNDTSLKESYALVRFAKLFVPRAKHSAGL
jgi:hypothetical protein